MFYEIHHLHREDHSVIKIAELLELIRDVESGTEKATQGTYRHEQYKKAMDAFLDRRRK